MLRRCLRNLLPKVTDIDQLITFEVGGWDGVTLSNTCNFWNFAKSIFIEANRENLNLYLKIIKSNWMKEELLHLMSSLRQRVIVPHLIFKKIRLTHIDFLSIDVDGMDYFIFRDLDVSPKVVLINLIPFHVDVEFIQPENYK